MDTLDLTLFDVESKSSQIWSKLRRNVKALVRLKMCGASQYKPNRSKSTSRTFDRGSVFVKACPMYVDRTRTHAAAEVAAAEQQPEGWRFVPDTILPGYQWAPQWVPARTPTAHWARSAGRPWVEGEEGGVFFFGEEEEGFFFGEEERRFFFGRRGSFFFGGREGRGRVGRFFFGREGGGWFFFCLEGRRGVWEVLCFFGGEEGGFERGELSFFFFGREEEGGWGGEEEEWVFWRFWKVWLGGGIFFWGEGEGRGWGEFFFVWEEVGGVCGGWWWGEGVERWGFVFFGVRQGGFFFVSFFFCFFW